MIIEGWIQLPMLVKVTYCISPGTWRVIIGPGVGLMDGGSHQTWPEAWVPPSERRPNGEFRINGFVNGVPQLDEKQTGNT